MKSLDEIKEIIDTHKNELRKEHGLKEICVFGSYVRGAQRADSDLDILIEFEKPVGFVKFLRLERRLSALLGVRVEMVMKKALKPFIGKRILQEVIYV